MVTLSNEGISNLVVLVSNTELLHSRYLKFVMNRVSVICSTKAGASWFITSNIPTQDSQISPPQNDFLQDLDELLDEVLGSLQIEDVGRGLSLPDVTEVENTFEALSYHTQHSEDGG